jgi:hypothetical protein
MVQNDGSNDLTNLNLNWELQVGSVDLHSKYYFLRRGDFKDRLNSEEPSA